MNDMTLSAHKVVCVTKKVLEKLKANTPEHSGPKTQKKPQKCAENYR